MGSRRSSHPSSYTPDTEVEAITSEPLSAKRQRECLENCIKKLQDGHKIFRGVMGSDDCFVDGKYWIRIYNNNLRFLNNVPHNANVVDIADLGRSTSSSGATCF